MMISLKILLSGITLGLLDGIVNPCTISVIVFMVLYLINLGASKRRVLKCGISFVVGVSIVYLLFMLSLLRILEIVFISYAGIAFGVLGIIALVLGLIEIKDFFFYGKGISLKIPESFKKKFDTFIKKASVPSSFLLGCIAALGEIPCAGFFPFAYTTLVTTAARVLTLQILYIFWYIIFYAMPLALIVLAFYFGLSIKAIENYYEKGRRWMRLITGIAMICLGMIFLFNPAFLAA